MTPAVRQLELLVKLVLAFVILPVIFVVVVIAAFWVLGAAILYLSWLAANEIAAPFKRKPPSRFAP